MHIERITFPHLYFIKCFYSRPIYVQIHISGLFVQGFSGKSSGIGKIFNAIRF